mmetsp:Transcript_74077/g.211492  ORF Transcript_74077/g.211492 Transcript_74077/m.211492 type:complete len:200 (+) Transcript_74077:1917-2516(+)
MMPSTTPRRTAGARWQRKGWSRPSPHACRSCRRCFLGTGCRQGRACSNSSRSPSPQGSTSTPTRSKYFWRAFLVMLPWWRARRSSTLDAPTDSWRSTESSTSPDLGSASEASVRRATRRRRRRSGARALGPASPRPAAAAATAPSVRMAAEVTAGRAPASMEGATGMSRGTLNFVQAARMQHCTTFSTGKCMEKSRCTS